MQHTPPPHLLIGQLIQTHRGRVLKFAVFLSPPPISGQIIISVADPDKHFPSEIQIREFNKFGMFASSSYNKKDPIKRPLDTGFCVK
jgi:hypothetical protein